MRTGTRTWTGTGTRTPTQTPTRTSQLPPPPPPPRKQQQQPQHQPHHQPQQQKQHITARTALLCLEAKQHWCLVLHVWPHFPWLLAVCRRSPFCFWRCRAVYCLKELIADAPEPLSVVFRLLAGGSWCPRVANKRGKDRKAFEGKDVTEKGPGAARGGRTMMEICWHEVLSLCQIFFLEK